MFFCSELEFCMTKAILNVQNLFLELLLQINNINE